MPKYLILPGCDDTNRGDQALIWETVELAKEAGYNGEFYMLADADKAIQSEQRNINHIEYILPHPSTHFKSSDNINYTVALKIKWALAAVWDLISRVPLLYPKLRKLMFPLYSESVKESLRIFEMSAVSFVKGGGFLHAYGGIAESYKIYYFLYHIRLALSYGQEIYIMPNSFGPFEGKIVKHMIKKTLAKCKVVMSRESVSREKLESVCSITSELHSDLAFFLSADNAFGAERMLKEKGIPIGEKTCVALTMRPYRFPGHKNAVELYDNYKTALSEFIIWLSERGFFPVLVEHVACNLEHESDMSCIKNVVQMLENRCSYGVFSEPSLTCEQMKAIYGCFDYTVGTRFHSVIFSLAEGVPSMAVTYGGNKGQGIMKDLQMDKYAVSIDEISKDKLADVFLNLEHNSKELKKKLMIYQQVLDNEKNSIVNLIRKENGEWQH